MWWKYYVVMHVNGKMRAVESILRIGRGDKRERWRGEFNYDIS
jgi:hypothetical protein